MRKHNLLLILVFLIVGWVSAQDQRSVQYAETITAADLEKHLTYIASEELAGRDTGSEGQKKAAAYITEFFKSIGLQGPVNGDYHQKFELVSVSYPQTALTRGKEKFEPFKDFVFVGEANYKKPVKTEFVFAGTGKKEEWPAAGVNGKFVAIWAVGGRAQTLAQELFAAGATGVIVCTAPEQAAFDNLAARYKSFGGGRMGFAKPEKQEPLFLVGPDQLARIFGVSTETLKSYKAGSPAIPSQKGSFAVTKEKKAVATENILGFLPGTDKKDEVLVVSAHYDHVAPNSDGSINFGADDNGSGTVAIMEIAEAFALAAKAGIKPRRSVLFIALSAEEKGLLGSQYYVENPVFPLENTVNNLNIDMLGRIDNIYLNQKDTDYLYAIGSGMLSSHLKLILDYNNITFTGLNLDYRYDDPNDPNRFYYRSDHYNFAKYNIPSIFFFSGLHNDYHTPADVVDKIEFPLMTKRAKLIFHTSWDLANREKRTPVDGSNTRSER